MKSHVRDRKKGKAAWLKCGGQTAKLKTIPRHLAERFAKALIRLERQAWLLAHSDSTGSLGDENRIGRDLEGKE